MYKYFYPPTYPPLLYNCLVMPLSSCDTSKWSVPAPALKRLIIHAQKELCNILLLIRRMKKSSNRLYYKIFAFVCCFNWTKTNLNSSFCCTWSNAMRIVLLSLMLSGNFLVKQLPHQSFWPFLILNRCLVIRVMSVFITQVTLPIIINLSGP